MWKMTILIWYYGIKVRTVSKNVELDLDKARDVCRKFRISLESWKRKKGLLTTPDRERARICYEYSLNNNWTEKDMSYLGTMIQYSNYFEAVNYFSAKMEGKTHEQCLVELC